MQKTTHLSSNQSGQVGVIVLLISAIILVVGLSIANRTIKESQGILTQEDSARVFSTAESGIQQALGNIFQFESGVFFQFPVLICYQELNFKSFLF